MKRKEEGIMDLSKKKIIQLICINIGVGIGAVVAFSPGLIGLTFSLYNAAQTAIATGVSILLVGVFGYGNYSLLIGKSELRVYKQNDFKDIGDYIETLNKLEEKCFPNQIKLTIKQIGRMEKKIETLKTLLGQFFTPGDMSYNTFMNVVSSVTNIFFGNVQNIINRIMIFDIDDFKLKKDNDSAGCVPSAYQAQIDFIQATVEKNDEIIDKLDGLLLEVTELSDVNTDVSSLTAMKELERLINNTQYYKE